jgi:hypothetical protein
VEKKERPYSKAAGIERIKETMTVGWGRFLNRVLERNDRGQTATFNKVVEDWEW